MNFTCVALEPGGGMRPTPEAVVVASWRAGGGPYWVDISGASLEAIRSWLAGSLGLDPELLELLQARQGETRILPLAECVFVAYPLPADEGAATDQAHFAFLCLDRLVVTMHERPQQYTALEGLPLSRLKLREGTAAGVVCALAIVQSSHLRHHVVSLRREGDGLAHRMDEDPELVPLKEILAAKRRVLALGGVVDEELAVLEVLRASNLPVLPLGQLAGTLQIAIEVTRATDRDIDRLDARVSDLQRRYESAQQEKTNRRLGLLTVISAIFMPLTLLAGIYGMNFEVMPELHWRYGYPVVLAGMALLAGGLTWYLRSWWK